MLKFLHLSDLHIGKRLSSYSLADDQRHILRKISEEAKNRSVDALFISGDVFDSINPSEESVSILDSFLTDLNNSKIKTYIISGNHDPDQKLSFLSEIVQKQDLFISHSFNGSVEKRSLADADIYLLPFLRPCDVRSFYPEEDIKDINSAIHCVVKNLKLDNSRINILLCHQFVTSAEGAGSEEQYVGGEYGVDYHMFEKFEYVALGHIHRAQSVGWDKIRYSGSPLKYSISETQDKVCIYGEISKNAPLYIEEVRLKPLRDIIILRGTFEEIIKGAEILDDYVFVTLTDEEDVTNASNRLVSKFPFFLGLVYDNKRTRSNNSVFIEGAKEEEKTPIDYLNDLFYKQLGKNPSDEQEKLLSEVIEEIWRSEE